MKNDFIAKADEPKLADCGLANFEALWKLDLEPVDEPNIRRGGVSSVCCLQLDGHVYYLKRQQGYFTRSLRHPCGQSLCEREWRNIQTFQQRGIAALTCAFFGARDSGKEQRAILLTHALDGFNDLTSYLNAWPTLPKNQRESLVSACGELARNLHQAGQKHGCLYPKHIFLKASEEGWQSALIDLEKARPLLAFKRDRISDLEPLLRRTVIWNDDERRQFFRAYLGSDNDASAWLSRIDKRHRYKQGG